MSLIPDHMQQGCAITGLIVDQLAVESHSLKTFGIHCKVGEGSANIDETPTFSSEYQVVRPVLPDILRGPPFNSGPAVTWAKLSNIKQLRILKRETYGLDNKKLPRCCGLWICHGDGSIETLGIWDGCMTESAKVIYNAETDGRLNRVIFQLRRGRNLDARSECDYVANIAIRLARPGGTEEHRDEEHNGLPLDGDKTVELEVSEAQPVST